MSSLNVVNGNGGSSSHETLKSKMTSGENRGKECQQSYQPVFTDTAEPIGRSTSKNMADARKAALVVEDGQL
eukprot:5057332-Ditylum_brightwellii.AAC.1